MQYERSDGQGLLERVSALRWFVPARCLMLNFYILYPSNNLTFQIYKIGAAVLKPHERSLEETLLHTEVLVLVKVYDRFNNSQKFTYGDTIVSLCFQKHFVKRSYNSFVSIL